jgi:hypothetical protein
MSAESPLEPVLMLYGDHQFSRRADAGGGTGQHPWEEDMFDHLGEIQQLLKERGLALHVGHSLSSVLGEYDQPLHDQIPDIEVLTEPQFLGNKLVSKRASVATLPLTISEITASLSTTT